MIHVPTFQERPGLGVILKVLGKAAVDVKYVPVDATAMTNILDVSISGLIGAAKEKGRPRSQTHSGETLIAGGGGTENRSKMDKSKECDIKSATDANSGERQASASGTTGRLAATTPPTTAAKQCIPKLFID